jgi:hypothetical protein
VFSPFVFTGKAAATKTLSFWQFYAPARQVGTQIKANGLKTVSRVGMRPTMSRSSCSLSQFRTVYMDPSYRPLSPRVRVLIFS